MHGVAVWFAALARPKGLILMKKKLYGVRFKSNVKKVLEIKKKSNPVEAAGIMPSPARVAVCPARAAACRPVLDSARGNRGRRRRRQR